MKKQYLIGLLLLIITPLYSVALDHRQKAPAIEHLLEVNAQWIHYQIAAPDVSVSFNSDIERIQYHLNLVHTYLASQQEDLSVAQLSNRTYLLNELKEYAQAAIFPTNTGHTERTPYFIDKYGVHCAVGFLIMRSGNSDLSNRISQEYNYSLLADIKTSGVIEWANEYGFTFQELEWIQPSYQPEQHFQSFGEGTNGNIVRVVNSFHGMVIAGNFDSLDNMNCYNIGVYKDNHFSCLGDGVIGTVKNVVQYGMFIYASGTFYKNGQVYQLAIYNEGEWTYSSIPNREHATSALFVTFRYIYVGVQGADGDELWRLEDDAWEKVATSNGVITTLGRYYSSVCVGGSYDTLTYTGGEIVTGNNLAIIDSDDSWSTVSGQLSDTIKSIKHMGNYVYVSGSCVFGDQNDVYLARFNESVFEALLTQDHVDEYGDYAGVSDFTIFTNNQLVFSGDFYLTTGFEFCRNIGALDLIQGYVYSLGYFDKEISTICINEDLTVIGGKFTNSLGDDLNHLAKVKAESGSLSDIPRSSVSTFPNPFTNSIHVDGLESGFDYSLRDIQGKVLQEGRSINNEINDLNELPSGMYILQLSDGIRSYELKVVK